MTEQNKTETKDEGLKKFYDTVAACNRCGFCTSYCPTYNVTGLEIHSPRGRNQAFRGLIEGSIQDASQAKEIVDTCILCGECTSVCFSEVPTASLMIQARNLINKKFGLPGGVRFLLYRLLPNPKAFERILKLSFLGKRLGISWVLRKLGILKRLAPALAVGDENMKGAPLSFLKDHPKAKLHLEKILEKEQAEILASQKKLYDFTQKGQAPPADVVEMSKRRPSTPKVAFMGVCGTQYLKPSIGVATTTLMDFLGIKFLIPENICCGLPAASYGDLDRVSYFAKENIERFERLGFDSIIVDDTSCAAHIKEWPQYFKADPDWFDRAMKIASKMKSFPEFLLDRGLEEKLSRASWTFGPVAFHDPCKAQYGLKAVEPPRRLMRAIPGLSLVSVEEADQCCGGGGTYNLVFPDMSREMGKKKIQNLIESGAKTAVTTSASCLLQLETSLRRAGSPIEALHLSEFLQKALRLP